MGFFARWLLAIRIFFVVWWNAEAALRHRRLVETKALPEPERPRQVSEQGERGAVRLLAVLQREGRLVDFLREDVSSYDDAQVGAAARNVHTGCRKALDDIVTLAPVHQGEEGARVTVEAGFDASTVSLVGAVHGDPPFEGTLAHHGWRATRVSLPDLPDSMDAMVVCPAEVEV